MESEIKLYYDVDNDTFTIEKITSQYGWEGSRRDAEQQTYTPRELERIVWLYNKMHESNAWE